jgi:general secretion pathway protein J
MKFAGGRQTGFTLVEMLVALVLISLIVSMLFGGLRLASRTWDGVEAKAQRTEAQRLARSFLRRSLLQSRKVLWQSERRQFILFYGDAGQLEFVTPLAGHVGLGGLYLLRVALLDRDQGNDLVLQRWLVNPGVLDGEDADIPVWQPLEPPGRIDVPFDGPMGAYGTSLLLKGVEAMELSYFGQYQGEPEAQWREDWKEQTLLPQLVRIRLTGDEQWPDLVVPLVDG